MYFSLCNLIQYLNVYIHRNFESSADITYLTILYSVEETPILLYYTFIRISCLFTHMSRRILNTNAGTQRVRCCIITRQPYDLRFSSYL